jgi:hypothetical protein
VDRRWRGDKAALFHGPSRCRAAPCGLDLTRMAWKEAEAWAVTASASTKPHRGSAPLTALCRATLSAHSRGR